MNGNAEKCERACRFRLPYLGVKCSLVWFANYVIISCGAREIYEIDLYNFSFKMWNAHAKCCARARKKRLYCPVHAHCTRIHLLIQWRNRMVPGLFPSLLLVASYLLVAVGGSAFPSVWRMAKRWVTLLNEVIPA